MCQRLEDFKGNTDACFGSYNLLSKLDDMFVDDWAAIRDDMSSSPIYESYVFVLSTRCDTQGLL